MHEKEILENLARSGRLASQTHKRALTHSLLNKALHCSLIQDSNVSSNSDSQPPVDTSTARYDRFRQQSHFCCTCESKDGVAKFHSRENHHAFNRDLPQKVRHHCSNCQQTRDRGMVTGDENHYFKRGSDLEDAASDDDECQQRVQRSTSVHYVKAPGTGYSREASGCLHDDPHYTAQKAQQPVLSQPIRGTTVIDMNASREDNPCSCREKRAVTAAGHVSNDLCQRCGGSRGNRNSTDYQQCRRCSCPGQMLQNGQDLTTLGGRCQEHKDGYLQNVGGHDGDLRQCSYNLEMNRRAEPQSQSSSDPRCMRISESKMNRRTDEGQLFVCSHGDQQYKRQEDQLYEEPENRMYRRSEEMKYRRTEGQEYRKPSEGLHYQKPEDQTYKATDGERYKKSVEDHVFRKQNSELLKERDNEGQKYRIDVHQQTDTSDELLPESARDSQWYQTAVSERSRLPEDNLENNMEDLENKEVSETQPRLVSQLQKIRDILLHQNSEEIQERRGQENLTLRDDEYVEKDHVDPQNRNSSDQNYTRTTVVEEYGGNASQDQQEETRYSPQSKRVSRIQQSEIASEIPQSERLSHVQQSERVSRIQQSERTSDIPQSERASRIQQSLRTDDNPFRKSPDIPESEVVTSNQWDMRTNPQSKRVTIDQQFWGAGTNWSSKRTTFDQQSKTPGHVQESVAGDDLFVKRGVIPQSERVSHIQQSERTGDDPQSKRVSHIQPSLRASEIPQSERASHIQQPMRASEFSQSERVSRIQQSMRASEFPQSERASHIQQSMRASEFPQSERVSRVQQSIGDDGDDNQFVKSRETSQSERASRILQSVRTVDNKFVNSNDILQSEVSLDQQYVGARSNSQSERGASGPRYPRTTDLFVNSSAAPQSEKVIHDQQYTRTNNKLFVKSSDNQQFGRASHDQQNVKTLDCPCSETSDNLYVRPSDNQRLRTSGHQELIPPENGGEFQAYRDGQSCRTCDDNQQYTNSVRKPQHFTDKGNKTVCSLCKSKGTMLGQRCQTQIGGILKETQTVWSRMEEAELQDKQNFDAAMKQMSEYMNSISQVCECYYDSCSKDGLSLLERRHLRMFHKGVLPCRQQPKKKLDTSSEDTSYTQPRCPCSGSVNRLQREDKSMSENRPQGQGRMPSLGRSSCTDRSQNYIPFSDAGPCLDPDLEDDSELENTIHRADNSQTAGVSQTTGKPQFCVRFSDTGAEPNQTNKNSHHPETSETCTSSLTSGIHQKDIHVCTSSREDKTQVLSTESATDNTWNSQSDAAGLATCTSSSDSCRPASSSLKHQACAKKSGHKGAAHTRHSCPAPQKQKPTFRSHLRQGVFIEGVSAFPTKVSKIQPKSSKMKARSSRIGSEQGICITTKPGSYIVKKPKEDSSIHLLQVNPGNYVKLNL